MKKLLAVLSATLLMFSYACASEVNTSKNQNKYETGDIGTTFVSDEDETTKDIKADDAVDATMKSDAVNTEHSTKPATEDIMSEVTEPSSTISKGSTSRADYGSKDNPAKLGSGVVVSGTLWDGTVFEYTIFLSNLRRGSEAEQIALNNNKLNIIPEGQEAIVFDVEFSLDKYEAATDEYFWLSDADFEYYTSNDESFSGGALLGGSNAIEDYLLEGEGASGDVILSIPEADHGYLVFDNYVFFQLP